MPPTESEDLRELRRLLGARFKIDRIVLTAGRTPDESESDVLITKTPKGETLTFRLPQDAAHGVARPGPISWAVPNDVRSVDICLRGRDGAERTLRSKECDVWDVAATMHPSLDHKGERVLRRFRDSSRQIEDSRHLVTLTLDKQKRAEYLRQSIANSGARIDPNLKTLLLEYLRTADWAAVRFLPLKEKYFELQEVLLHEAKDLSESKRRIDAGNPHAVAYSRLVDELLNAFWQQEEGFLKRSMKFTSLVRFDVVDAIVQAVEQRRHVEDLLGMLAKRGSISGRQGIPHLLDVYRRYCEVLRPFIDVLSDMACAVEKLRPLAPNLGYKKRVAALKATRFGAIVHCLDPDIRHSESHGGTVVDDDNANVFLTEIGEDGHRQTLGQYSYWQISDMTLELQNGLFLAVLTSFALHETGTLLTAVTTPEFVSALVSIGNLAD